MNEFLMIPNSLTMDKSLGDKRIVVYAAIYFSEWDGNNIEQLVNASMYSIDRHSGSVLNQFKDLVSQYIHKKYFDEQMAYIRPTDKFGIIYYSEFQRILERRDTERRKGCRINHAHILLLLSHIRMCIVRKPGLPEMYSDLLSRIAIRTGLSVRSISACLKILEELNIIHSEELPRYKDSSGRWHSNVRIFVNMNFRGSWMTSYDWRHEVSDGIRYILASQFN